MSGIFDRVAREEIRKRGDQFLNACNAFVAAANNMTAQLQKLNSMIEMGKFDPRMFAVNSPFTAPGVADLAKKTDEVARAGNSFGKALREF